MGLIEGLRHLGHVLSGFTVFALLRKLFRWLVGAKPTPTKSTPISDFAKEFRTSNQQQRSRWPYILSLLGLATLSTPLIVMLWHKVNQVVAEINEEDQLTYQKNQKALALQNSQNSQKFPPPQQLQGPPPPLGLPPIKPGDWLCPCGEFVVSIHTECRQCGAQKPQPRSY